MPRRGKFLSRDQHTSTSFSGERRLGLTGTGCPSFSIVIPTYQRCEVVCAAVRALGALHYSGDLELIVVVDGSLDGTADALRRIDLPFPIAIIEQPNSGPSTARNRGAAAASNDIILFLDDDMIAEPDLVEQHARMYRLGADAVIGDVRIDAQSGPGFLPDSVARGLASTRVQSPLSPFDIFTGQLSVRRAVFTEIGGFDSALTTGDAFGNEDADFAVALLADYDVRHNAAALSRQRYVVTPREYMQRATRAATADLQFVRKHPLLARQLFQLKRESHPLTKFVLRPLSRMPFVSGVLSTLAVNLAEIAEKSPLRGNRALARFFSGARSIAYWSALRERGWSPTSGSVLVLCYHSVDRTDDPVLAPYSVPPDQFGEHLDSLVRRGYTFISPDELFAFRFAGAPVPKRAALLTFDDGYADLVNLARETLRPRGIRALVFVVSGMHSNEWDRAGGAANLPLLDDDGLRQLAALGVEIGSHSRTHRLMPLLEDAELGSETQGSLDELTARGVPSPRFFAYPYGARNAAAVKAVAEAGFLAAFGPRQSKLKRSDPAFDLPRVQVLAADRGMRFRLKTAAPASVAWLSRAGDALGRRLARWRRIPARDR